MSRILIVSIYIEIFFALGVELELFYNSYLDFSPGDVTRFQTAVAASNDVTQILVVPVETDLHFSSQNLAPFLVAWLLEHVFAALRCICTHAHTSTLIFSH